MTTHGKRILQGARDALAYTRGERGAGRATEVRVPAQVNVRSIRDGLGLTQVAFAARFGFSVAAVRDWEQGRRRPDAPTRVLLMVIAREPDAVERALRPRKRA